MSGPDRYRLHDLAVIDVADVIGGARGALAERLAAFAVPAGQDRPDIQIVRMKDARTLHSPRGPVVKGGAVVPGVWAGGGGEGPELVHFRNGGRDMILTVGETITLAVAPTSGNGRRVHRMTLFALDLHLRRRAGLLCHGAVVVRDGKGILMVAPRGTGKTAITVACLRQGAGFLTDDQALLSGGHAHVMRGGPIPLRPHHIDILPDLPIPADVLSAYRRKCRVHAAVRRTLEAIVPQRLLPANDLFLRPALPLRTSAFPDARTFDAVPLHHVMILAPGAALRHTPLDRAEGQRRFGLIQDLLFNDFRDYRATLDLCWPDSGLSFAPAPAAFGNAEFSALHLPATVNFDAVAEQVLSVLPG